MRDLKQRIDKNSFFIIINKQSHKGFAEKEVNLAILITHPPTKNGKPTWEGMKNLFRIALPILEGVEGVVTTGSFRSDSAGEALARLLELPLRKIPELGPIHALPLPQFFSGEAFNSLIGSPEIVRLALWLWTHHSLPGCEPVMHYIKKFEVGLRKLGSSVAIIHREGLIAKRVIEGATLTKATEEEVSHLEVSFWNQ